MAAPMKGQVCVVTGASRGIGRGIALQLCQAGATVYITGRHMDTLRATAEEVGASPGTTGTETTEEALPINHSVH